MDQFEVGWLFQINMRKTKKKNTQVYFYDFQRAQILAMCIKNRANGHCGNIKLQVIKKKKDL